MRQPGIEPRSIAWKATMLTFTPPTLYYSERCPRCDCLKQKQIYSLKVRQPGIEPGSIAWKATMLTFTPPTPTVLSELKLVV